MFIAPYYFATQHDLSSVLPCELPRKRPEGLSPEGAYAFQCESENDARLIAVSGVEYHMLDLEATAIPCPSTCRRQVDEAAISSRPVEILVPKIVADRETAVRATIWMPDGG